MTLQSWYLQGGEFLLCGECLLSLVFKKKIVTSIILRLGWGLQRSSESNEWLQVHKNACTYKVHSGLLVLHTSSRSDGQSSFLYRLPRSHGLNSLGFAVCVKLNWTQQTRKPIGIVSLLVSVSKQNVSGFKPRCPQLTIWGGWPGSRSCPSNFLSILCRP